MVSPELLRRYPQFAEFTEERLRTIAMISDEAEAAPHEVFFEECSPAANLYLLIEGVVDLYFTTQEEYHPDTRKEFPVGEINPGEFFGISSLIEPYVLNASARAAQVCRYVKIDAGALRETMRQDPDLGFVMMKRVAAALMERLAYTRVQLAAAWS